MNKRHAREEEDFSKDKFLEWLKEYDPLIQIDNCVFEPNGPSTFPDFSASINGRLFNLEVTSVLDISTAALSDMHDRFVNELEVKANKSGVLGGMYEIVVERAVPDFKRQRDSLERKILRYVEQTKNDISTPWERIICG